MRHFKDLGADLSAENSALAEALRALFGLLGESLNGYAARMYCDKGAVSRYLAGRRVPDCSWVRSLHDEVLGRAADPGAVMPWEQLEKILDAAQLSGGAAHQNRVFKRRLEQREELLRAAQQLLEQQQRRVHPRPAEEQQETSRPESTPLAAEPAQEQRETLRPQSAPTADEPAQARRPRPIPRQLAQVSEELKGGLHMERLPDLLTQLHDVDLIAEARELLGVAARRPLPQMLHALRCLEAAGLSMEADLLISCAALRPPAEAVALVESLRRGVDGIDEGCLGNFLSALSLREPPAVAEIADLLAPEAATHTLWWELLTRAGDRCVEDVAAVMEALHGTRLVPQGVKAVFSGQACQGADRASRSARLVRLLHEKRCVWQRDAVLAELAVRTRAVQQVVDMVIALHEVGQHDPALQLAPAAVRVRRSKRWRDKLAHTLERQGLRTEAGHVRRTPVP
ncbi:hypothetical protein ACWC24_08355 [Streptomyces sp. NPDC001443]